MAKPSLDKLRAACADARIDVPPLLVRLYEEAAEDRELRDALRSIGVEPKVLVVDALDLPPARRAWLRDRFVGFAGLDEGRALGLWRPPGAPRGRAMAAVVDRRGRRFFSVVAEAIAPALRERLAVTLKGLPGEDEEGDPDEAAEVREAVRVVEEWLAARATAADEAPPGEGDLLAVGVDPPPKTEAEALNGVKEALRRGDLARARGLVSVVRRSVASDEAGGRVSGMLFHEGQVAEAEGDLEEAVRTFRACRDLDEEVRAPGDVALPEVHRSLAIVARKAGLRAEALTALARAGTLYRERRDPLAVETFSDAAALAFVDGDHPRAEDLAGKAIDAAEGARGVSPVDLLDAHTTRARTFIARRRYRDAFHDLVDGSRIAVEDSPDGRRARAECWLRLGGVSIVFGCNHQAAACYATTLALTDDADLCAEARALLAQIEERLDPPLDGFRVVHVDHEARRVHVMDARKGLYVAVDPGEIALGERVEIARPTGDLPFVSIVRRLG